MPASMKPRPWHFTAEHDAEGLAALLDPRNVSRFERRVTMGEGSACHAWTGGRDRRGAGRFHIPTESGPRSVGAPRVAWSLKHGPIPTGHDIAHVGKSNLNCVNADHLVPMLRVAVVGRGENQAGHRARQTACEHGHPLPRKKSKRRCLTCAREQQKELRDTQGGTLATNARLRYKTDAEYRGRKLSLKSDRYKTNREQINERRRQRYGERMNTQQHASEA